MARKHSSSLTNVPQNQSVTPTPHADFDIQYQIEELEKIILECFRIPLTRWTIIDEEKILDQLDVLIASIPEAIKKALAVLEREQQIMTDAETHYQQMIESAQQRAADILDQTGIIQQAELEAAQIRQQVQQECEAIQRQTLQEIEQMRQVTTQEMTQHRQQAIAESQEIYKGADDYADRSLGNLENRLGEMIQELGQMLQVVRNGRQQIQGQSPPSKAIPPQLNSKRPKLEGKKSKNGG